MQFRVGPALSPEIDTAMNLVLRGKRPTSAGA